MLGMLKPEQAKNCKLLYHSQHVRYNTLEYLTDDIESALYQRLGTTKDTFVQITTEERNRDLLQFYALSEFEKS